MADFGDNEYKSMLCVDGAAIERPITLKPGKEWTGKLVLTAGKSSFCFDQLEALNYRAKDSDSYLFQNPILKKNIMLTPLQFVFFNTARLEESRDIVLFQFPVHVKLFDDVVTKTFF